MPESNGSHRNNSAEHVVAETITAKSYYIVDDEGRQRMSLYTDEDGTPVFTMMNKKEQPSLSFFLDGNDMPVAVFYGSDGVRQCDLSVQKPGAPHLRLFDQRERLRIALYVDENRPSLTMYDTDERLKMGVFLEEDGQPYIMFYDDNEQSQSKITVPSNNEEGLMFEDKEGVTKAIV